MTDNRIRVLILGAAGRDFHNFNVCYRTNECYEVVGFTAAQIPNVADRRYPPGMAGELYPDGIPIYREEELEDLIGRERVDEVVFSYSDVSHQQVMHLASRAIACGARFVLLSARETMLESSVPVVAVCAVRTGCGKSAVSRKVAAILKSMGKKVVVIRHPMPYGDLAGSRVQRFATYDDFDRHHCTIEEREEYEPHIGEGNVVYAGVDYAEILAQAEEEADVILWDGGNNDLPFYVPGLHITLVDPHRAGHELLYHPGEANLIMADAVLIPKQETSSVDQIALVKDNIRKVNPGAVIIDAESPVTVTEPELIKGRSVLVVEDGPSVTHGGMPYGAGYLAAQKYDAGRVVEPGPYVVGSLKEVLHRYTHIRHVLPAMGYGEEQMRELEQTISNTPCDLVIAGTPIDLRRLLNVQVQVVRATYEIVEKSKPDLRDLLVALFRKG